LYPELRIVEDEATQVHLLQRAKHAWSVWLLIFVAIPLAQAGAVLLHLMIDLVVGIPQGSWVRYVVHVGAGVAIIVYWVYHARSATRRALREELRKVGYDVCLYCGYDTRNLPEARCPECGRAFEPTNPDA
jgi:hypothetical protein